MRTGAAIAGLALLLAMAGPSGCVSYQQAMVEFPQKAQPYARTWANPGWPRPDLPPDRDARSRND